MAGQREHGVVGCCRCLLEMKKEERKMKEKERKGGGYIKGKFKIITSLPF